MFWIVVLVVCVAVAAVIAAALWRARDTEMRPSAAYDLDLYRDQLKELERDRARGIIAEAEAERAKLEISRRILEADRALQASGSDAGGQVWPLGLALGAMIAVAVVIYAMIGAPGYPDVPLEERIAEIEAIRAERPSQAEAEANAPEFPPASLNEEQADALAQLRASVDLEGDDIEALLSLARAEAQARNYGTAHQVQARAAALMGPRADADVWVNLARMQILAAGGYISPEAEDGLDRALSIDPRNGDARFLLGAMYQRQNRPDLAFAIWRDLLNDSTSQAPWIGPIFEQIEEVAFFAGQRIDLQAVALRMGASGPSREQMDAAAEMSPQDRMAMIEGMVEGLAAQLATDGGPPEDWARLVTSLGVLGQDLRARAILTEARVVFGDSLAAQAILDQAEASLPTGTDSQ